MPSFVLIHPTVWSQYTNVTDRTDRQDRQTDNCLTTYDEPFYEQWPKKTKTRFGHLHWKWIGPILTTTERAGDRLKGQVGHHYRL